MQDLFVLLHEAVGFHDGRLVCWLRSAQSTGPREQFFTPNGWHDLWIDDLTNLVAQRGAPVHTTIPFGKLLVGGDADIPAEITYFGVPATWEGQLWGVLELRAGGAGAIGPNEQAFVAALLPLLAAAIAVEGGAGLVPTLPHHPNELTADQAEAIGSLRAELEAPLTLNALLSTLLSWALDSTGAEAGAINMVDHERGELAVQVHEGYTSAPLNGGELQIEPRRRFSWDVGVVGKVARTGRALLVRDVNREPDFQPGSPNVRAELAVPIMADGKALAVLVLNSPRSAAFGDGEVAFAQAICDAAPQPLLRAIRYQHLLETSTQLSQVITSMPIGLALLDGHGRILRHNPAWPAVWGVDPVDADTSFHLPWDLVPLLLARLTDPMALNDFCAHGQSNPTDIETTTIRLRDPHQELDVLSVPTRDSLGQLTGRLWVVSDVTREREADRL
jgi:GAF domain-containing protein